MILMVILGITVIAFLMCCSEAYHERKFPMRMIRFFLIFLGLTVFSLSAFGQNVRWDLPITTVQSSGGNLLPVFAIPNAQVSFYSCTGTVCTTLANTYNASDSTDACPTGAQVVLNESSACIATADAYGNMGSWFQPGQYMATITANGGSYNYYFTIGEGGVPGCLTTGCTFTGPIYVPNAYIQFINGVPQADQFPGTDFCVKLRAANVWALANGYSLVDATHFPSTVSCSIDPVTALNATPGATVDLVDELPASLISTTVPWVITNSLLSMEGKGAGKTILQYVGTPAPAVLTLGGSNNVFAVVANRISKMSITGLTANATDGFFASTAHYWHLDDVSFWGVTGCGIHTEFAVTPTITAPVISQIQANFLGYGSYSVPASGICMQDNAGGQTTDGTVIDPDIEGVSSWGIDLISANSMTFTSGASEQSGSGLRIQFNSQLNTFIGLDVEANTSMVDVLDDGNSSHFINIIAASAANSVTIGATSRNAVLDGGLIGGTPGYVLTSGAQGFSRIIGNQITGKNQWTSALNSGAIGWNATGTGDTSFYNSNYNAGNDYAFTFWGANTGNSAYVDFGGFQQSGFFYALLGVVTPAVTTTTMTVGAATQRSFAGVPSGSCAVGDTATNTSASSASTVFYVCYPANTYTAVTVP